MIFCDCMSLLSSIFCCFRYADLLRSGATGSVSISALVSAISAGMRALPEDPVVQTNGCRLLAHIAVNDSNQLAIAKECGVKAVLMAMKNFPCDSAIQESSCRVLGLLSYHCTCHNILLIMSCIKKAVELSF